MLVDLPLHADGQQQEEEVHPKNEGQQGIEDGGQADELHLRFVLTREIDQTQKYEQFGRLRYVEVGADVFALEGLAVYGDG